MIETGGLLLLDQATACLRRRRGVSREGRSGHPEAGAEQVTAGDPRLEIEMGKVALHPPNRRDAVRYIKEEDVLGQLWSGIGIGQVAVHLGESRHQIFAAAVHPHGARRQPDLPDRPHLGDTAAAHDHRLVVENAVAIHRHDVDVHERNNRIASRFRKHGALKNNGSQGEGCDHRSHASQFVRQITRRNQ
jgi:hypothetical protein